MDNSKKYKPGEEVIFTISATNTGGKAADLKVTDTALDGLTVKEITSGNGSVSGNTITFNNVAAGATVTATVVCTIDDSNTIQFGNDTSVWLTNTAKGSYDGKETPEAEASIEVEKVAPAVSYQKTGYTNSGTSFIQGQDTPVTYVITVKNNGNTEGNFEYSDVLPAGITTDDSQISASVNNGTVPDGAFTLSGSTVSGSGKLDAGQVLTITVKGTLNTENASVKNELDRPTDGTNDTVDSNKDDETITFTGVEGKADISYSKTGYVDTWGNTTYTKGLDATVHYTLTARNSGNVAGTLNLNDELDSDITDVSITVTPESLKDLVTLSGNTITGSGSLPANTTLTIEVTGTLNTTKDEIENTLGKDTVTFTGKDAAPNFVFEKTGKVGDGNTYIEGQGGAATYTIKVTNNGTADGTIKFTDTMPAGVTLDAGQTFPGGVTASGNTITVEKALKMGETLTIPLKVTIAENAAGALENTLTGIDAGDGTYGGDTGETFYSTEATINISANKSGHVGTSGNQYEVGDEVTYEIVVSNSGNTDASNVSVVDTQPDGIQFTSYKIGTDAAVALTGDLNISIPTVKKGESVTVTITGKVVSVPSANNGNIENIATVDGKDTGKVTFQPKKPNLTIGKKVNNKDREEIVAGQADQTLTFTITGRSTGEAAAKNVVIKDTDLKTYVDGGQLTVSNISAIVRNMDRTGEETIAVSYDALVSESGFVMETLEPNKEVIITIECKTTDQVSSISNTATIKADDVTEQEDTVTATPPKYGIQMGGR